MRIYQETKAECRMNFYFVTILLIGQLITIKFVTQFEYKYYCVLLVL